MINNCPNCNAPLQENAVFCPHCMTQLAEKQTIETPKIKSNKKKKALCIIIAVLLIISVAGGSVAALYHKKHSPICTYEQFQKAVPLVSEKMEIDNLWEPKSFIDTHYLKEQNMIQYSTDINIKNAALSVFFYNKGEQVLAYITDVSPENYPDAESLLKCITQSSCNYYFTDIDKVFDDEKTYPKKDMTVPFDEFYTDLVGRTEQYNNDMKNKTIISTRYIEMLSDDIEVVYFVTERNTGGDIIYDLSLNIMRAD